MTATPAEVVTALIDGVTGRRWEDLPDLYAPDARVVHPMQARNLVIHRTMDPEVVIAEFDYVGQVTTTGRPFDVRNIFVVRVRDGQIVESRDYAYHAAMAAAMGDADR
jgi:ketosteroid isomerase-like protein